MLCIWTLIFTVSTSHSIEVVEKPTALQLLLLIPEAVDVSALSPPPSPSLLEGHHDELSVPNCYLICKLFCAKPHPHTPVQWASRNPQFGIKQVLILHVLLARLVLILRQYCHENIVFKYRVTKLSLINCHQQKKF